jgi:hypothetical protein
MNAMVSQEMFEAAVRSAADVDHLPMLYTVVQPPETPPPNLEVGKAINHVPIKITDRFRLKAGGFKHFGHFPPAAKVAVECAKSCMENQIAKALELAPVIQAGSFREAIALAHAHLDRAKVPTHDRFGIMNSPLWRLTQLREAGFVAAMPVWRVGRYWESAIWFNSPYLEERSAVLFHRSALEGDIRPVEPGNFSTARAAAWAKLVNPAVARGLAWSAAPAGEHPLQHIIDAKGTPNG